MTHLPRLRLPRAVDRQVAPGRRAAHRRAGGRRLLAAVLAAAAVLVGVSALRPSAEPTVAVQVAGRACQAGHRVGSGDVEVQRWPQRLAPAEGAPHRVVGAVLLGPVQRGERMTTARLRSSSTLARSPGADLVVSVPTGDLPLAQALSPGDRVSVFDHSGRTTASRVLVVDVILPSPEQDGTGPAVLVAASRAVAGQLAAARTQAPDGRLVLALNR
ncbi:hypothetical protein ACMYYO_12890 [Dermacoccaceae bacterium W4C1]